MLLSLATATFSVSLAPFFILLFHTSSSSSLYCSPLAFSVFGLNLLHSFCLYRSRPCSANTPYLLFLFLRHHVHFGLNSLSLSLTLGPWVQWVNEFSVVSQWHWREARLSVSLCISNTLIPEFICADMCTGTAYHDLLLSLTHTHTHAYSTCTPTTPPLTLCITVNKLCDMPLGQGLNEKQ